MHLAADGLPIFDIVECWDCHGRKEVTRFDLCPRWGKANNTEPGRKCSGCGATRKDGHRTVGQHQESCKACNGEGTRLENRYDHDTSGFWKTLPMRVFRSDYPQSAMEQYLGVGLCSVMDYGRHKDLTDEALIEKVKSGILAPQYCTYVNAQNIVAVEIVILCNNNGYSVLPVF